MTLWITYSDPQFGPWFLIQGLFYLSQFADYKILASCGIFLHLIFTFHNICIVRMPDNLKST
jgi:hypothetical protein